MPLPVLLVSRMFNASIYTNDVSFNQNEIEDWTHTADVFFKETRMDVECEASLLFLPLFFLLETQLFGCFNVRYR